MATFYGSDTSCVSDTALIDLQITDPRVLIAQRIARRLQTPRGALGFINDDPNFGWDVRQYINAKLSPGTISTAEAQIQAECLKDEQVYSVSVSMTNSAGVLSITVSGQASPGPFTLTMNVGSLTTDLVFSF